MVNKAEFNIKIIDEFIEGEINSLYENIKIIEKSKINEAKAWVIKYFNEDSEDILFFNELNKGIIDNKLISNPIHILNHEYDEIEIIVPITILLKKIIL